ncbi:hypothetical protein PINS_up010884 [Pythium insidiosum]|nr:hypothetical protein PINS_up010884 [Pythium insidiosum]
MADARGLIVMLTVMQLAQRPRVGGRRAAPLFGANPTGITQVVFSTTPMIEDFITYEGVSRRHFEVVCMLHVYILVCERDDDAFYPLNIRSVCADGRRAPLDVSQ